MHYVSIAHQAPAQTRNLYTTTNQGRPAGVISQDACTLSIFDVSPSHLQILARRRTKLTRHNQKLPLPLKHFRAFLF